MATKLSDKQREVLQLARDGFVEYTHHWATWPVHYQAFDADAKHLPVKIDGRTIRGLVARKLVKRIDMDHWGHEGRYHITDAGRAALATAENGERNE